MGLFDSIQNIIGGITGAAQGSVDDVIGNISEVPVVQDLQEQASTITDGLTEATNSVAEQGQEAIDTTTQNFKP